MDIIGHRGCADQYPENTVTAVTESSRRLDAVEVDVRRCGSGELVVFHDERVDDLTAGTGRVDELEWRRLQSLEVANSGEGIPRLSTVLAAVPRSVRLQIELKEDGVAADVRDAVRAAEGSLDTVISSFRRAAIEDVNDCDWDVPTGYLFESEPANNLAVATELGCDTVHPHYDCCLETDVVSAAHERGFDVIAWKAAKTPEEVAALRAVGVDGVTADRWDLD